MENGPEQGCTRFGKIETEQRGGRQNNADRPGVFLRSVIHHKQFIALYAFPFAN